MNDLEDVALAALDAAETADAEQAQNGQSDDAADTSQGEAGDDASSNNNNESSDEQGQGGQASDGDSGDSDENDEKSQETEQKPNENGEKTDENDKKSEKSEKKEMTDEEFEKMARERGYFRQPQQPQQPMPIQRPDEVPQDQWDKLPRENQVIYSRLPYITVHGADGKEYNIKTQTQLPDDFEFASKKEEINFNNAIQAQENLAQQISNAYRGQAAQQQRAAEANMVVSAVDKLQSDGLIPKIMAKPGTAEFDKDPGVLMANKILDLWGQRRKQGANISIEDAAYIYKASHPDEFKAKQAPAAKGDAERKQVASKIGGGRKSADTASNKQGYQRKYYRPGMSTEDVLDRVLDDME